MNNNEIKIFNNDEFGEIRVIEIDGKPYFVGNDIAEVLEYKRPYEAVSAHCDGAVTYRVTDSLGRERDTKIIPEGDLFRLIVKAAEQSKSPRIQEKAKRFESWVFDEVLPSIRKHGAYMTAETLEKALVNPDTMIHILTNLKEEQQRRQALEEKVAADAPKIALAESIECSNDLITISRLANILAQNGVDIGQNRLYGWLRDNGYIYKDSCQPTQRALDLGVFRVVERPYFDNQNEVKLSFTTKVTGKGQQYFVDKFLKVGVSQ